MGKLAFVIVSLVLLLLVPDAIADFTSECGGNLNVENDTFNSPNYPFDPYGPSMNCTWRADISGGMFLYFDLFNLDGSGDYIAVEDENGFVGTYFGIQRPFVIQSFSNVLYIKFISGNKTNPNWSRHFSGSVQKDCKINYLGEPYGYIFTPLMQEQNASKTFTCTWRIANFVSKGIILSILTADFTNSSANLLVYEGAYDIDGKLLGNFSAENPAHAVVTSNNEMYINLTYDTLTLPTLTGLYRTTTAECTKNVKVNVNDDDDKTTVISSIGYPIQYRNDLECWWLIESDMEDSTLGISVDDVNLSDDGDRLVFYSSTNLSSKPLAEVGGSITEQPFFVTEGNMMLVSFRTGDMGTAGGFSFQVFAQDIGGVIRPTDSGNISLKLQKNKRILYLLQTDDDLQPVVKQVKQTNYPTTGNLTIYYYQDSWKTSEPLVMQTPAQGIVPVIFSNSQSMFIYAEGFDEEKNDTSLTLQVTAAPSGTNLYSRNAKSDSFTGKSKENYWIINPSFEKGIIELTFQDLPTHGGRNVTINQGLYSSKSQNIASFTSNTKELSIHIPIGDPIRISFVSKEKTPLPFYANYHIIDV
ncbi:cubilin-like [Anneissia japonica]|uniref:cubilin-like n=1 Tax=Anneissia japonica TaxID=1529436 RepID=UPI001425B63B|nr:cubilin-like [Anneissia japonica]